MRSPFHAQLPAPATLYLVNPYRREAQRCARHVKTDFSAQPRYFDSNIPALLGFPFLRVCYFRASLLFPFTLVNTQNKYSSITLKIKVTTPDANAHNTQTHPNTNPHIFSDPAQTHR